MSLLEVKDISQSFGDKKLFKESSFELYKGEHMGIVGQNGAGKSTLMKILIGEILSDDGSIIWQNNVKIGHLDQYAKVSGEYTVYEYLKTAFKELYDIEEKLEKIYIELGENYSEELMEKISKYQERLEVSNFYALESEIDKTVKGLGIDAIGIDKKVANLSGGQRAKVILAKLLLQNAEVLLLDEPTNFLDREHIEWLGDYLNNFKNSFIVISHDFEFLNSITNCICDIEFGKIQKYYGNYEDFVKQKEERRKNYIREYEVQQREIKKTEEFIRRNKAGVNSKIARGRQKQLDRVERMEVPKFNSRPQIEFIEDISSISTILEIKNLEVGYEGPLLPKMDFNIVAGEKIAITGFNGIGKSTLLKTIIGEIPKISGNIKYAKNIKYGYFKQDLKWENNDLNPLEILSLEYPKVKHEKLRRVLSRCGINAKDIAQPIRTLSGGEQSKVKLSSLMMKSSNFLIMDEPTNHLDDITKEALKEALINYNGTVLIVSHDKSFYSQWIDKVYEIKMN